MVQDQGEACADIICLADELGTLGCSQPCITVRPTATRYLHCTCIDVYLFPLYHCTVADQCAVACAVAQVLHSGGNIFKPLSRTTHTSRADKALTGVLLVFSLLAGNDG